MSCESFKLPRINSCSQNQSPKQKSPLSDTQTYSHDAQKSRPFHAGLKSSATSVRRCLSGRNTKTTICSGHLWCMYCDISTEVDWWNTSDTSSPLPVCRVWLCQKAGPDCWAWLCAGKSSDILNTTVITGWFKMSAVDSLSGLSEFAGLIWWALRKRQDLLYCYDNSIITHQYLFTLCLCFEAICVRGKWMTSCTAKITLHLLHARSWFHAGVSTFWLVADWLMKEIIISKKNKKQWELNWCTSCSLFIKSSFYLKDKFSILFRVKAHRFPLNPDYEYVGKTKNCNVATGFRGVNGYQSQCISLHQVGVVLKKKRSLAGYSNTFFLFWIVIVINRKSRFHQ